MSSAGELLGMIAEIGINKSFEVAMAPWYRSVIENGTSGCGHRRGGGDAVVPASYGESAGGNGSNGGAIMAFEWRMKTGGGKHDAARASRR